MTASLFAKYIPSVRWLFPLLLIASSLPVGTAISHEHSVNESAEQARVIEWLKSWKRPGGNGYAHRTMSCCYISGLQQDCFPVKETRIAPDGSYEVFPDVEGHFEYARWYKVPPSIDEANQPDPRESPDSRSYVCIAGSNVICFVAGAGF